MRHPEKNASFFMPIFGIFLLFLQPWQREETKNWSIPGTSVFMSVTKRLSTEEFFLSESRIMQIIRDMIQAGVTVDGKKIEKPLFTGFKLKPRSTSSSLKSSPYVEGQLFACP